MPAENLELLKKIMIDFATVSFNSDNNGCIQAVCSKQWKKPGCVLYGK